MILDIIHATALLIASCILVLCLIGLIQDVGARLVTWLIYR